MAIASLAARGWAWKRREAANTPVDQRLVDADVAEIAEADVGKGLVELPRQRRLVSLGERDDRQGLPACDLDRRVHQRLLLAPSPYLSGSQARRAIATPMPEWHRSCVEFRTVRISAVESRSMSPSTAKANDASRGLRARDGPTRRSLASSPRRTCIRAPASPRWWRPLRLAERGKFDLLFLADTAAVNLKGSADSRGRMGKVVKFEPMTILLGPGGRSRRTSAWSQPRPRPSTSPTRLPASSPRSTRSAAAARAGTS